MGSRLAIQHCEDSAMLGRTQRRTRLHGIPGEKVGILNRASKLIYGVRGDY